jgi:hypothetical protein
MKKHAAFTFILTFTLIVCVNVQAVFMVETHETGRGFSNFAGTPRYSATAGGAPGLLAKSTAYGNLNAFPDVYTFSYTPGTDADNWSPPQYEWFGNGVTSSGLAGGESGYYSVFITWPESANIPSLCDITAEYDGGSVILTGVDMNTGGTGTPGANAAWLRIAENVPLMAGNTYTVTQSAQQDAWTSMRSAGVMWEYIAPIPEPATALIFAAGSLLLNRKYKV